MYLCLAVLAAIAALWAWTWRALRDERDARERERGENSQAIGRLATLLGERSDAIAADVARFRTEVAETHQRQEAKRDEQAAGVLSALTAQEKAGQERQAGVLSAMAAQEKTGQERHAGVLSALAAQEKAGQERHAGVLSAMAALDREGRERAAKTAEAMAAQDEQVRRLAGEARAAIAAVDERVRSGLEQARADLAEASRSIADQQAALSAAVVALRAEQAAARETMARETADAAAALRSSLHELSEQITREDDVIRAAIAQSVEAAEQRHASGTQAFEQIKMEAARSQAETVERLTRTMGVLDALGAEMLGQRGEASAAFESLTARVQDLAVRGQEQAARTQELAAQTQGLTAHTQSLTSQTQGLTVRTENLATQATDVAKETRDLTAGVRGLAVRSDQIDANAAERHRSFVADVQTLRTELAALRDAVSQAGSASARRVEEMRESLAAATAKALREQGDRADAAQRELQDRLHAEFDTRLGARFQLVADWVENIHKRDEREAYSLDTARKYWTYAPTGTGKISSEDLLRLDDKQFKARWNEQYESRVNHYFEERFFNRYCAGLFKGKRVLSFGSGLGVNEIQFLRAGTKLTCADIVETNLRVIERVAKIEKLKGLSVLPLSDPAAAEFGGPYDYIYVWGSLMTMPFDVQRAVMSAFKRSLAPKGRIYLLLYTRTFLQAYCQVDSPTLFARASDPSVGELHNPWSDWHDDAKLMDLAGEEMVITNRQFWNQDYYVTYALGWRDAEGAVADPGPCFDLDRESAGGPVIWDIKPAKLAPLEAKAEVRPDGSTRFVTTRNKYFYAASSDDQDISVNGFDWVTLELDATLDKGAFSVGVLDLEKNAFAYSRSVSKAGRHTHYFSWAGGKTPKRCRIMLSNHRDAEGVSEFAVHRLVMRGNAPGV
ncbi:MAG: methyltransferase domain-containing protein [Planctomycetes bacterium]|nr:methyltransferase domain-containing protein [Planctomycetota bacterium]